MAARKAPANGYHSCSCGESFETTELLLEHAREEHGLWIH